jgi:signal transduction histidine kinase
MKILNKAYALNLSDKILLILFVFTSILFLAAKFIIGGSIEQILVLGGVVYVCSFFATFIISRRFSNRIIKLAFIVEEMAAGNFSKKIKNNGRDEIDQLVNALNELNSRLQTGVAMDVGVHRELAQAKTDFVTLASHQLRTPLSIIKWYVDFLITGDAGEMTKEQLKYLKEVYDSNERLIELVNALLDVSRIDVGTFSIEPEPTDLIQTAETALKKHAKEIKKKNISLEKKYDKFSVINLDPRLTGIVFENIISNAVKYTPENGKIRLSITKTEKDAFIKLSDTGCGIPREQQPKMFTKLFRADNVKRIESVGTGLGLYIVKAVIEKSGGKIWFESPSLELLLEKEQKSTDIAIDKQDKGTTIFITIPLKGMKKKHGTKKLTSIS